MSGKKGALVGLFGLALIGMGIFISVISFGVALPGGLALVSFGLTLLEGVQSARALEKTSALQRSTPTFDQSALGAYVFGTTIVPMNLIYEELTGAEPDRVLHDIYAHCWHRIEGYLTVTVATDAGPEVVSFSGHAATGAYANLLWFYGENGAQTFSISGQGAPFDNNSWPTTAIFAGVAHSAAVWNIDDDAFKAKFSSIPTKIEVKVQGAWLYDPRLDPAYGTGSQDFADPTTWSFNDGNAALVLLRVLIGEKAGSALVWGRGALETDIDMDSFITAANVADEALDSSVRYRLGGMWLLSGSFEEFVTQWEQETGGKLSKSGGQYKVWLPNDDLTALTTITEADVVQGAAIQHTIAGGLENLYNTARGRYIDAANGYVGKPYAEVSESSAVTADGGKRVLSQDFSWVQSEAIAQRVARIRVRRSRFQRVWAVPVGWKGQGPNYAVFSVHYLNCKETNYSNQLVRVIDRKMSFMGLTVLTLQQEDASIYDETVALNDPLAGNNVASKSSIFGTVGATAGTDGVSTAVTNVYKRAASAPSTPTGGSYEFASTGNILTPPTGWSVSPPATDGNPLYVSTASWAIVGQVGTDSSTTWTSPVILVEDGTDGASGISVHVSIIFKRSASAPSTPTGGQYNFSTTTLTPPSGWSEAPPVGSDPLYSSTGTWSVTGATGTDTTTTWSTPVLVADAQMVNGPYINRDPWMASAAFWETSSGANWEVSTISDGKVGNSELRSIASADNAWVSEAGPQGRYAIDATKTYRLHAWVRRKSGNRGVWLTVRFFDSSGTEIVGGTSGATGWTSLGSQFYWALANADTTTLPADSVWREFAFTMGAAGTGSIPTGAKTFCLGAILNYQSSGTTDGVVAVQDFWVQKMFDLTTDVFGQLSTALAAAGLINTNISVNADGSLTGAGGGAPVISSLTGSVATGQLTTNVLAALQAVIGNLAAIKADIGTITAGTITLDTSGHVKSGQTAFNTGSGFFLGYSSGAGKFSLGNPSGNYLTWDGSTLKVRGVLDFAAATFTPTWGSNQFSPDPTGDVGYVDFGSYVVMWSAMTVPGTSSGASAGNMSFTGVPAAIRPTNFDKLVPTMVVNNGVSEVGSALIQTSGAVLFSRASGTFTTSGDKAWASGAVVVYPKV